MIDEKAKAESHGRRLDIADEAFKKYERDASKKSYTLIKTCVPSKFLNEN
jgi:hypothetical protein